MNERTTNVKVAGGISLIAGLWLMLSSYFMALGYSSNEFVVGLLVAIFALIELFSVESSMWVSWVNGILGLWLLLTPLFFAGMAMGVIWNSVILGIVVIVLSIWSGMSSTMGMGHPKMG
ncbi:MAG TPA: SPW repeat protein [Patescibacteria group bacterium]